MNMISITVYREEITEIKSIPYDDRLFDEHRVKSYKWLSSGLTRQNVKYVADHYTDDTVDILFDTQNIVTALLGAMDVYDMVMNDGSKPEYYYTIKNI
jgi:hypothetical protein